MKYVYIFIWLVFSSTTFGQVTALDYIMNYNCETNLYEVKIKVIEGSAISVNERVQFNSQISILVPTGLNFEIVELNNPIENNQYYDGTIPGDWKITTPVISPVELPESDFYSISPKLTPASFFNDLSMGDEVLLFQCKIGTNIDYNPNIRFYENNEDPPISSSGSDFRNGYAIGTPQQIYHGNQYTSCLANSVLDVNSNVSIYPNPFLDRIIIDMDRVPSYFYILDINGKKVHSILSPKTNHMEIPTEDFIPGMYIVRFGDQTGDYSEKIVRE